MCTVTVIISVKGYFRGVFSFYFRLTRLKSPTGLFIPLRSAIEQVCVFIYSKVAIRHNSVFLRHHVFPHAALFLAALVMAAWATVEVSDFGGLMAAIFLKSLPISSEGARLSFVKTERGGSSSTKRRLGR